MASMRGAGFRAGRVIATPNPVTPAHVNAVCFLPARSVKATGRVPPAILFPVQAFPRVPFWSILAQAKLGRAQT